MIDTRPHPTSIPSLGSCPQAGSRRLERTEPHPHVWTWGLDLNCPYRRPGSTTCKFFIVSLSNTSVQILGQPHMAPVPRLILAALLCREQNISPDTRMLLLFQRSQPVIPRPNQFWSWVRDTRFITMRALSAATLEGLLGRPHSP